MGFLRYPKTTQEKRLNERDRGFTRGKRRNIPSAWDDLIPRKQRSWKKHRKHKYREDNS